MTKITFYLSILAIVLAAIGALGLDLWLASTQWMIVGAVLAIWSIYLKDEEKKES
jgi:hypothetical protein